MNSFASTNVTVQSVKAFSFFYFSHLFLYEESLEQKQRRTWTAGDSVG